jgi:hypothetical protein
MCKKKIWVQPENLLLIVYVYYQPNSCNTHAEREGAGGTFLRQWKKVPSAHAQRVYLEEHSEEAHTGLISLSGRLSVCPSLRLSGIQKHVDFSHRN